MREKKLKFYTRDHYVELEDGFAGLGGFSSKDWN